MSLLSISRLSSRPTYLTPWIRGWATGERILNNTEDLRRYLTRRYPRLPSDAIGRRIVNGYAAAGDGTLHPLARGDAVTATSAGLREDLAPYVLSLETPALFVRGARERFRHVRDLGRQRSHSGPTCQPQTCAAPTITCLRSSPRCWPRS